MSDRASVSSRMMSLRIIGYIGVVIGVLLFFAREIPFGVLVIIVLLVCLMEMVAALASVCIDLADDAAAARHQQAHRDLAAATASPPSTATPSLSAPPRPLDPVKAIEAEEAAKLARYRLGQKI